MRWLLAVFLLLPIAGAITDPGPSDIRWACGAGSQPIDCGINPIGGEFPSADYKDGDPEWSFEDWIDDSDRVMGLDIEGDVRAVPIKMLNSHEIVNDEIGGVPVAITFCPLCGSGITYDRRVIVDGEQETLSFTASGYLWNSDMVMWEPQIGALWNQVTGETIGHFDGRPVEERFDLSLDFVSSSVATWGDWKSTNPNTLLLQPARGGYSEHPYGSLETNCQHGFNDDNTCDVRGLHPKTQVVVSPEPAVAFPWLQVAENGGAYLKVDGTHYAATATPGGQAAIYKIDRALEQDQSCLWRDAEGRLWSTGDFASLGERVDQGISFWFAWEDHHPETALWMTNGTQGNELRFDDGHQWGFAPWVVLIALFGVAAYWKWGRREA